MARTGRLILAEGWDVANSSTWPAYRWSSSATGATVDVQSGGGRVALAGVTGGYVEQGGGFMLGRVMPSAYEIVFDLTLNNIISESYATVYVGDSHHGFGTAVNGVGLSMWPHAGVFTIQTQTGGVASNLGDFAVSSTPVANVPLRVRYRREGPAVYAKMWDPATAEPGGWGGLATTYLHHGPGYAVLMLGLIGGSLAASIAVTFDNLQVFELVQGRDRLRALGRTTGARLTQSAPRPRGAYANTSFY